MKKLAKIVCLCFLPIGSCESPYESVDPESMGCPAEITFTALGGTYSCVSNGKHEISQISLYRKGQDEVSATLVDEETLLLQVENDWLVVNTMLPKSALNVFAKQNTTGKKRKMYLKIYYSGGSESVSEVSQSEE